MLSTSVSVERATAVVLETSKVAVSSRPFGTVLGDQFVAVFQSPLVGLRFQVALPAKERATTTKAKKQMTGKSLFIPQSQQKAAVISRQYEEAGTDHWNRVPRAISVCAPNDCRNAWTRIGAISALPARFQQCGTLPSAQNTPLAGAKDRV
jgi:hypothetical protein